MKRLILILFFGVSLIYTAQAACTPSGLEIVGNYIDEDCDGWINLASYAVKREHPRIWLTDAKLAQLNASKNANSATWQFYRNYINARMTPGASLGYGVPPYHAALIYQVTGNASYCTKAIEAIYSSYLTTANTTSSPNYASQIQDIAIAYDWCYDFFNSTARATIGNYINARMGSIDRYYYTTARTQITNNINLKVSRADCTVGYAFLGEIQNTTDYIDNCQIRLNARLQGYELFAHGGDLTDMEYYGPSTLIEFLQGRLATKSATNILNEPAYPLDLSEGRINYMMRMLIPKSRPLTSISSSYDILDGVKFGQSDLRGFPDYMRENFAMLSEELFSTNPTLVGNAASYINYYPILNNSYGSGFGNFFYDINRLTPQVDHRGLSLSWFASGGGMVVMKSNWSNTTTSVAFRAADRVDGHQDLDANSFTVYSNGGDLILQSGMYPGETTSDYMRNYKSRTVAGNSLLVYDSEEDSDPNYWDGDGTGIYTAWNNLHGQDPYANDGGQRDFYCSSVFNYTYCTANYGGQSIYTSKDCWSVADYNNNPWKFNTADILRYEDGGNYVYSVGDATNAYRSTKMNLFKRSFVYLRPNGNDEFIITFDKVEVKPRAQNFSKKIVLHTMNEPVISGSYNLISGTAAGGIRDYGNVDNFNIVEYTGGMKVNVLLPESKSLMLVGGSGYEYYNERNFPYSDSSPQRNQIRGNWRVEIDSKENTTYNNFLTTMETGTSVKTDWENTQLVESSDGSTTGMIAGNFAVMFNKHDSFINQTQYSLNSTATIKNLVVDLRPNTVYYIYDNGAMRTTTSSSQGTLFFNVSSGSHTIRISETTTVYHAADSNMDNYIGLPEIMAYIGQFKLGSVTRTNVLDGIRNFFNGRYQ